MTTDEWVQHATAALLADDAPSFRAQHYAEYRQRLLAVAARCSGAVGADVHLLVDAAGWAFELEDYTAWNGALTVLEAMTGGVAWRVSSG